MIALPLQALDPARQVRDYRIAEWGRTEGLPYPSVAALAQTPDGYLWVGTRMGLARFDGVTFTTFTTASVPQLADDRITVLFTASDGTLWVGTGNGVSLLRNGIWERGAPGSAPDEGAITAISEEADHSIVISRSIDRATGKSNTKGLYRYVGGKYVELNLDPGIALPRIDQILRLSSGGMLLAGRGLFLLEGNNLTDVASQLALKNPQLVATALERDDTVWLGGPLGLLRWSSTGHQTLSHVDGLPSNSIRSLALDHDNNLWVGTSNGLARYRGGRFEPLLLHGVEPLSNVLCQLEDAEHNLWVGTDNGLFRVQDVKVTTLGPRDGLPVNPMLCVLPSMNGGTWVGTMGGGLSHIGPDGIRPLHVKDGLKEESIGALAEDAHGGLWIAYLTRGISHYRDGNFRHYAPGEAVRFRGLAVDSTGGVWAASSGGLFRFNGETFEPVTLDPALKFPRALHVDRENAVWVAGGRAYGRLHEGKWAVFQKPREMDAQSFQCIFSDSRGDVWVLQDAPFVIRVHNGQERRFAFPELGPLIYSGFEANGELWISFRAGVARIPLGEFDAVAAGQKSSPHYTLYNEADGMRSLAPNVSGSPGSIPMPDGTLWFCTSMGVAMINPEHIRLNERAPNVVIERVLVDKKMYPPGQLQDLPPGRGELAIHFTALSFTNPPQVRFKYRLVGFDAGWVDGNVTREAHYGGLPPGRYRFEVTACNEEGIWSPLGATTDLTLTPHFYQRWWFFAGLGLSLSGGAAAIYQWRSRRLERRAQALQRQNAELERRISERTSELRKSYVALRSSEYFYHSLVESMPNGIARKDAAGRYTYANAAAVELFGHPLEEIIGHTDEDILPPEMHAKVTAADRQVRELGRPMEHEDIVERNGRKRFLHIKRVPLYDARKQPLGVQVLFWDTTAFRETEDKLKDAQRELVEISRLAGMAEMATGVLHNLGNALNSVKVSATTTREKVTRCDIARVRRIAELLQGESHRLADFFATDPRGAKVPDYLMLLSENLEEQQRDALAELQQLAAGIELVATIIAAQQEGARATGIIEQVTPQELVEYACRVEHASLERNAVSVIREFMPVPAISVDRQKALQILGNLLRNGIEALAETDRAERRLTITVRPNEPRGIQIRVTDNGVGIPAQNLDRIFRFGFTTKRGGHGFGLHNSAVAAQDLGGALRVESAGPGRGSTFTLDLPFTPPVRAAAEVPLA